MVGNTTVNQRRSQRRDRGLQPPYPMLSIIGAPTSLSLINFGIVKRRKKEKRETREREKKEEKK